MQKTIITMLISVLIFSCSNPSEKATIKPDTADTTKPVYAYTIKKPDNWEMNSSANTVIALNALKAFEDNKIDESLNYFGDSVIWRTDYMEQKFSKDSLKAIFKATWASMASLKVYMRDFESVISKDKQEEYVTLWYHQTMVDKKGKKDSMAVTNDIKMSNGKIVELDEAFRHIKPKK